MDQSESERIVLEEKHWVATAIKKSEIPPPAAEQRKRLEEQGIVFLKAPDSHLKNFLVPVVLPDGFALIRSNQKDHRCVALKDRQRDLILADIFICMGHKNWRTTITLRAF